MQTTTEQALNHYVALTDLGQQRLPGALMMRVHTVTSALKIIVEAYEKTRESLLEQYGTKGDDDKLIVTDGKIKLTDAEAFNKETQDALAEEHAAPSIRFDDAVLERIEITLPQMEALMCYRIQGEASASPADHA